MSRRCAGVPGPERASRVLRAGLDGTDRLALKHNAKHDYSIKIDMYSKQNNTLEENVNSLAAAVAVAARSCQAASDRLTTDNPA